MGWGWGGEQLVLPTHMVQWHLPGQAVGWKSPAKHLVPCPEGMEGETMPSYPLVRLGWRQDFPQLALPFS
jgi:hypothetical protein